MILEGIESVIVTLIQEKLIVIALLDDLAVREYYNIVGVLNR